MAPNVSSPRFTHYPLLWLSVCFAAGILTANYLASDWEIPFAVCIASALFAAIFTGRNLSLIFLSITFISAGSFAFEIEARSIAENRLRRIYDEHRIESGEPVELEGVMLAKSEPAFDGLFLKLKVERVIYKGVEKSGSGKIRLFAPVQNHQAGVEYELLDLRYGSRIRVACNPEREDRYLNPGVISRKEILNQQDLDAVATVKSPLLVEKLSDAQVFAPIVFIYNVRRSLISEFRDRFSGPTAGILMASLLGDKYFLDKQVADVFREGGTFHVLVISGLHITFIGGFAFFLAGFFTKKKLWQFLAATLFLWAYTLAVGAEVPVVRASLMFTILVFSQVMYRQGTLLNALGACALLLLTWRPQDLFNPSFQLTMVSVAAIVAMAFPLIERLRSIGRWTPTIQTPFPPRAPVWLKRFCEMLYWREDAWRLEISRQVWSANLLKSPYWKWVDAKNLQRIFAFVFEGVLVSFIVQLWLLPLLVIYFHRLSVASVLLNLWVGVFIALESFSALIAVLFAQISGNLALPFVKITEAFNWLLLSVPGVLVENHLASFRLPIYSGPMRSIYFVYFVPVLILAFAAYLWNPFSYDRESTFKNAKPAILGGTTILLALFSTVIAFHPLSAPKADGKLRIDFLDVGQGDAALITFPNGETMLVDGGGTINYGNSPTHDTEESEAFEPDVPRIGEAVVSEFLWEKGYSKIDYILATHSDIDHIQGLIDVARNFAVKTAYFGRTPANDPEFAELSQVLEERSIPFLEIERGDALMIGGARIDVLNPLDADSTETISDNNRSVVLRVTFGGRNFLLTGDIEREAELALLHENELLEADVVKVPHHGSRTSSTTGFVDATQADYAIISVGQKSTFGHPHSEVVERWKSSGARIMTTGNRGMISIITDGNSLTISTLVNGSFPE